MVSWLIACLLWIPPVFQPEVNSVVSGVQAKYSNLNSLSADFVQVYTAPGSKPRRETGRVAMKKPGKMRWDYTDPERKSYSSDGKSIIEYVEGDRFATRTGMNDFDSLLGPFRFLLGKFDLRSDFGRIEVSPEAPVHAGCRVLRLVPKKRGVITEVLLEVFTADWRLSRVTLIRSDRSRTDFIFSSVAENKPLDDSIFRLNLPAGVVVRSGRS